VLLGAMMELNEFNTMNIFHVLVKETHDHQNSEWFGSLTLLRQENGEIFLDISFTDREMYCDSQDQGSDRSVAILSIESIENADLQDVESLKLMKISMDRKHHIEPEICQIDHEEAYYEYK
jgi:hypothetical protein